MARDNETTEKVASRVYEQEGLNQAVPTRPRRDTQQLDDENCFYKARQRGQRTFTLVEQDVTSVRLICEWIKENIETAPAGKLHEALAHAITMRSYYNRRPAT